MDTFTDGFHQLRVLRGVGAMQATEAVEDGSQTRPECRGQASKKPAGAGSLIFHGTTITAQTIHIYCFAGGSLV